MKAEVVAVLVSAPDVETARRIGRALVEERLAACVNLVPGVSSIYRWRGAVEEAAEVLLVAKTRAARADALAARVRALHPYELPEVVVLPVRGGSRAYLQWVAAESR
jgi:periplasmic divalent cation tolerance protein